MRIDTLGIAEIPKLKKLHDRVFNRNISYNYFEWLFQNPYGVVLMGMYDDERLIGSYCGELRRFQDVKYAACSLSMIDPEYRGQGLIIKLAKETYQRLKEVGCKFLTFFVAPEKMRNIYEKYLGFRPIPMKKYWLEINHKHFHPTDFIRLFTSANDFKKYRYIDHPTIDYSMFLDTKTLHYLIVSKYHYELQLIDYTKFTDRMLEMAVMEGAMKGCKYITTWYPTLPGEDWVGKDSVHWYCYKHLDPDFPNWESKYLENIRLGMSDTY